MEFHISRVLREKFDLNDLLFSYTGNVVFGDVSASRRLAAHLNASRGDAGVKDPVHGAALFAMGLIDELSHAMVARYRDEIDPAVLSDALTWYEKQLGKPEVDRLLLSFTEQYPNVAVFRGEVDAKEWLKGTTEGMPNREAALEELLMLWLANINPAFAPFRELFEDDTLQQQAAYKTTTTSFPQYFDTRPPVTPEIGTLLDALRAPMLASPGSLSGQLDFIREHWSEHLGEELRQVLLAIDVLREEDIAIWMRFHPPGPDQYRHGAPQWGAQGFVGDEYVGFEEEFVTGSDGVRRRRYASDHQAPLNEYEAFSPDQAWMPTVVLIAKSTYVWLEQLSKKYGRHIHRLDQIPDEELQLLADRGISSLWLIGLWERSTSSQTIKRLRGHADAVASAYSLKEYAVSADLGGDRGYEHLRDRAAAFGLRLASDMVPNHMGIDSTWVIDNPDWFLYRDESPFPSYSFNGPDLSADSRVEIKIEDHYYDQTDAAVAFRVRHHRDGRTRYMYHGNDGTTFAWNDTAQLDYSKAAVREHVIQTILHVARRFPIIRFDAAMVLAKRHVQRLWFPLPGVGGSIPSRAEDAVSQEQFDALMPHEFWREVVDRVAVEVPGTLLLAEAFWMLEGYFVRTLGMHRVYNSAFMNMLRDEENAKYRSYLKKTIEFDPDILKRYVNFMSNPDERTTIDQFGSGDKCFGVATLMCTLPGLPMFGHGQIEGFTERYGMEYKQAKMEEWPDDNLVARHQHEIAPLLKNRQLFAESTNFILYDFWTESGTVDENVFAYSNRSGGERAVVLYNNTYGSTFGTIHHSAAYMDKGSGSLRTRTLNEGLDASGADNVVWAFRDNTQGLEFLLRSSDLRDNGLKIPLRGYQYAVLQNWRELHSSAERPWDSLCDSLGGAGVANLDQALTRLRVQPVHRALQEALSSANLTAFASAARVSQSPVSESSPVTTEAIAPKPDTAELDSSARTKAEVTSAPAAKPARAIMSAFDPTQASEPALNGFNQAARSFDQAILTQLVATRSVRQDEAPSRRTGESRPTREELIAGLLRLPHLLQNLSAAWPPCVRQLMPGAGDSGAEHLLWAPVVAWALISTLPEDAGAPDALKHLQMREALGEAFLALGFEGDRAWRAAARIFVLITHGVSAAEILSSQDFWNDPDVRWLAGVNDSDGRVYFNKEQLEELLCWLQLPALVRASQAADSDAALSTIEESLADTRNAAVTSGYDLDRLFSALASSEPAAPPTPETEPQIGSPS